MDSYAILKTIHIACAFLSITGFFIRGIWMMRSASLLQHRRVKIVSHSIDTLLLLSAIVLVFITAQYPGPAAWINAKIIALVLYITTGTIALNRGKTMTIRVTSWVLALLIFAYITMVALSKNAYPV